MRKILFVLIVLLAIVIGVLIWQKERVMAIIRPVRILAPFYKQPDAYDLMAMLEKNGLSLSAPPVTLNGTIQASISGAMVLFSTDKDLFTQVRSLQLILPRIKMEGKTAREIDLRFSKVVIRY